MVTIFFSIILLNINASFQLHLLLRSIARQLNFSSVILRQKGSFHSLMSKFLLSFINVRSLENEDPYLHGLLGAGKPNRRFHLASSLAITAHLKAPSRLKHIALPLINTHQCRDVAITHKYFSACFILRPPPFERPLIE